MGLFEFTTGDGVAARVEEWWGRCDSSITTVRVSGCAGRGGTEFLGSGSGTLLVAMVTATDGWAFGPSVRVSGCAGLVGTELFKSGSGSLCGALGGPMWGRLFPTGFSLCL